MSRGKRKQDKVADAPVVVEVPAEVRYPVSVYLENAKAMLGVTPYAIAGALHGLEVPAAGYTKSEITSLVNSFSNRLLT
jgi:hypothetical protein